MGSNPHTDDSDGDGTKDLAELRACTAESIDDDRDGTPDWVEAAREWVDSDGDFIPDGEEKWLGTNPNDFDTDKDRYVDADGNEWNDDLSEIINMQDPIVDDPTDPGGIYYPGSTPPDDPPNPYAPIPT